MLPVPEDNHPHTLDHPKVASEKNTHQLRLKLMKLTVQKLVFVSTTLAPSRHSSVDCCTEN
jgi:hypothetical protein